MTACAFVVLVFLGSWQLYRLEWKLSLIEKISKRVEQTAKEIITKIDFTEDFEYRRYVVKGRLDL